MGGARPYQLCVVAVSTDRDSLKTRKTIALDKRNRSAAAKLKLIRETPSTAK